MAQKMISIKSMMELPKEYCAMFPDYDLEVLSVKFDKMFGREPEKVYYHPTGMYVPITREEFDQNKATIAIWIPEERK